MAENTKIQAGDVVELKSGGPEMTVGYFENGSEVTCYWFDNANNFQRQIIATEALKKVKEI